MVVFLLCLNWIRLINNFSRKLSASQIGPILRYELENCGSSKVWKTLWKILMWEAFSDKKANTCSLRFSWKNTAGRSYFPWKFGKLQYCRILLNNRFFHAQKYGTKVIWMFTFSNGLITIYAKGVTAKPLKSGHLWVLKNLSVIKRCPLRGR